MSPPRPISPPLAGDPSDVLDEQLAENRASAISDDKSREEIDERSIIGSLHRVAAIITVWQK